MFRSALFAAASLWVTGAQIAWGQSPRLADQIRFSAEYQVQQDSRQGVILLTVEIAEGSHIYALTQQGAMPPSRITVEESGEFQLTGQFLPDRQPIVVPSDPVFKSRVEKHKGQVIFWAPLEIAGGVDPEKLDIGLKFKGVVCADAGSCYPINNVPIDVEFGGYYAADPDADR